MMSSAKVYYRVLLHYWWPEDKPDAKMPEIELLECDLFALECVYALAKNIVPSDEACSEGVRYEFEHGDFIFGLLSEDSPKEGVFEAVGEARCVWTSDYWGEVDEDVEVQITEKHLLSQEQMDEYFKGMAESMKEETDGDSGGDAVRDAEHPGADKGVGRLQMPILQKR
jgi:hypothetical protein